MNNKDKLIIWNISL